jgi:hypothetical protein
LTGKTFELILREGSRVRQKHNCLAIVFITAIVTTCFGRAWPSSGHSVDVVLLKTQQRTSPTYDCVFFSFVYDINIVT